MLAALMSQEAYNVLTLVGVVILLALQLRR